MARIKWLAPFWAHQWAVWVPSAPVPPVMRMVSRGVQVGVVVGWVRVSRRAWIPFSRNAI